MKNIPTHEILLLGKRVQELETRLDISTPSELKEDLAEIQKLRGLIKND